MDAVGSYAIETIAGLMPRTEEVWFTARTALQTRSRLRSTRYRPGLVPNTTVHHYRDAIAKLLRAASLTRKVVLFNKTEWLRLACLEALTPSDDDPDPQIICSYLSELHIYSPIATLHEPLLHLLKERKSRKSPVTKLAVYFVTQESGGDAIESIVAWKAASHELAAYVDQIEVVDVPQGGLPRMELVPMCTSQSSGVWNWPLWEDRNLDDL